MRRRPTRTLALIALVLATAGTGTPATLPPASWDDLPAWHGFNLLHKFHREWANRTFVEADFALIARHGFNFARLPTDYRVYVDPEDWTQFDPAALADFDRAVEWGGIHGVHICLNLHRIPGYTVASPPEPTSLWTDAPTQRAAAGHWAMWARRYRGIPNDRLSFNLFNEPADVSANTYSNIVAQLAAAIRAEDPDRLIIADGLDYARTPVPELIPLRVAQATRGYTPFGLTHYRAGWVEGSDTWPVPEWPAPLVNAYLYGPQKPAYRSALRIDGPFPAATTLRIRVEIVSALSRLQVRADRTIALSKLFVPGPGEGEWKESIFKPEWGIYQNLYDRDYFATIPAGTREVAIENVEGDWLTFTEVGLRPEAEPGASEAVFRPADRDWARRQSCEVAYTPADPAQPLRFSAAQDRQWLWRESVQPWIDLRAQGVGVMVGEWGCHNQTPHAVTLAWMRDCLTNYELAGFGWALWNLEGSLGPIDSGRGDVAYDTLDGRPVDRAMWELLREFTGQRERYERWRDRVFEHTPIPAAARLAAADANDDGVSNYFCYATALDPLASTQGLLPSIHGPLSTEAGAQVEFRYRQSRREVGSVFRLLASPDLQTWTERFAAPLSLASSDDWELRALRLPADANRHFFRLEIEPALSR